MSDAQTLMYSILLVEDNPADAELVRVHLKDPSGLSTFHVTHARSLKEASTFLKEKDFHVILLDLNLPETNGLDTLKRIQAVNPSIPIVVLTVTLDEPVALDAIKLGAQDYLSKSQLNSTLLPKVLTYAIERHNNDRIRRESETKYRLFVEGATGLAFIILDLNGLITHWNTGAEELFGYTDEEALGKHFSMLFTAEDQEKGRSERELQNARTNEKGDDDNWVVRKDGSRFWASGAVTAVRDAHDHLIGFAKVIRDKTSQKEAQDQITQLNRTLEDRVNQRTRELSRNQERLRAMASDLTLIEQRERRRLATDLHDYLAQLLVASRLKLSQGQSLTGITPLQNLIKETDSILDQALVYTRTLVSQLSPTCLYEFGLPSAIEWLGSEMEKQGLTVEVDGGHHILNLEEEQAVLIYQSVRELLFNVLKHSGVTQATVAISVESDNSLHIAVKDQGRGFKERSTEKDQDSMSKFGLFSIRERLEAIGGKFSVTSILGQGTQVLLCIPLEKSLQAPATERIPIRAKTPPIENRPPRTDTETLHILVVDDHTMVRESFSHLLNSEPGFHVIGEAEDGQRAIDLCRTLHPDVIIMDLHMPKMDGLEATRQIKTEFPEMVIIGLSVYDTPEVVRGFKEVGAEGFVTKSGSVETLVHTIRRAAPARPSS